MKILNITAVALALALSATIVCAQQNMDGMKGADMAKKPAASAQATLMAKATVKNIDAKAGVVTLAHEPINSLNWPAMTMGFKVADMKLLDKLAEGKKVQVELKQVGSDYVIDAVK